MIKDESYGVVPLREENGEWETLIVFQAAGYWGFPKGHKEKGEDNHEAARRELLEETGLEVDDFLTYGPYCESYKFQDKGIIIDKKVWFYPAKVKGDFILNQPHEVSEAKWVPLAHASTFLTFSQAQSVALQTHHDLTKSRRA